MITSENEFKIRLVAADSQTLDDRRRGVIFEVTPELSESRQVQYEFLDPVHAPGQIAVYKKSMSRRFQLASVKLASRSPEEASINLAYLWILRGWTMPYFGKQTSANTGRSAPSDQDGARRDTRYIRDVIEAISKGANQQYLGAPPQVLELSAYSRRGAKTSTNSIGHLYRVPCVIESLSINYPSDVDYMPTNEKDPTPMPTIMNIDLSLIETQSPSQLSNFSLSDYRLGIL